MWGEVSVNWALSVPADELAQLDALDLRVRPAVDQPWLSAGQASVDCDGTPGWWTAGVRRLSAAERLAGRLAPGQPGPQIPDPPERGVGERGHPASGRRGGSRVLQLRRAQEPELQVLAAWEGANPDGASLVCGSSPKNTFIRTAPSGWRRARVSWWATVGVRYRTAWSCSTSWSLRRGDGSGWRRRCSAPCTSGRGSSRCGLRCAPGMSRRWGCTARVSAHGGSAAVLPQRRRCRLMSRSR